MTRLICIKNPAIIISAPDELVSEVGGNCWQVGGPQPVTYPKHLWKKENQPSLPTNLDEAAQKVEDYYYVGEEHGYLCCHRGDIKEVFKAGAEWQIEQFEKNRLAACDAQTKEEYDMETAFVDKIIKEQHRTPTFSDAIKHGIEWMAGQGETIECSVDWYDGPILDFSAEQLDSAIMKAELEVGDKVVVQIRKKS